MICSETITVLKDIVVLGAAFVGSYVAIKGLGTWQRQLKGKQEYDLSRRILVSLYKYRDALDGVRHPAIWVHEKPSPPQEKRENMTPSQVNFFGIEKAYQARWDKVNDERTKLYVDLIESEALWGKELQELFSTLFTLQHELLVNVRNYLEQINPDTPQATKDAMYKITKNKREVLYDDLSKEPDGFKKEVLGAINHIEKFLKPKLGLSLC